MMTFESSDDMSFCQKVKFGDIELVSETCHDKSFNQQLLENRRKTLFTQFGYDCTVSGVTTLMRLGMYFTY